MLDNLERQLLNRIQYRRCQECSRSFDLFDEYDADEWAHGHDCEA